MTTRIGWSRPRPGRWAGGPWLFEMTSWRGGEGSSLVVGLLSLNRADLERMRERGKTKLRVYGALRFARDVRPEHVAEALEIVNLRGWLLANDEVRAAVPV